jgi:hypothetical protein
MNQSFEKLITIHEVRPSFPIYQYEHGLVCYGTTHKGEECVVVLYKPNEATRVSCVYEYTNPIFGFDKLAFRDRRGAQYCEILDKLINIS